MEVYVEEVNTICHRHPLYTGLSQLVIICDLSNNHSQNQHTYICCTYLWLKWSSVTEAQPQVLSRRSKQFVAGTPSILAHAYPSILPDSLQLLKTVTEILNQNYSGLKWDYWGHLWAAFSYSWFWCCTVFINRLSWRCIKG